MRLKSFHVRVFRNVIDSGSIEVTDNTCLVGKNEAGKSAVISALHRLNPAKPVTLDLLEEYPRWLKKQHEISGEINEAVPITATFELTSEEVTLVEKQFGSGVLQPELTVKRKYTGGLIVEPDINYARFIKSFLETPLADVLRARVQNAPNSTELIKILDAIGKEVAPGATEPTPDAQAAKQTKAYLNQVLGGAPGLKAAVEALLTPLIPKTFYFSNYSQLRGRYNMAEVLPVLTKSVEDEELQAAADFLKLARLSKENLEAWNFEQSNAELEAISSLLTRRVKDNWKQNTHLKLAVKIESVANGGQTDRFLQFRVEDTRHDFSSRLDRRSTGFQWFVSFMASFFEFEKDKNLILLLDEPGLSLHARAQMDLLDAIDKHLTLGRQVIYTTHSPFMVRTEALQRVRIVEDQGPEKGSVVTNDAGATTDPDTLFPLQAALGYDIAQNLFIGNRNILLEGTSDLIYLSVMSSHLNSLGKASFPEGVRLLPAGGATDIPTFIALLGGQLKIVVLLDGDAHRQRIDNAIAQGRLNANRVLTIDTFSPVKGADIEDMFTADEYLALYNATFGKTVKEKSLKGADRIVKRLERAEGKFDHGRVAAYFLKHQDTSIPMLSSGTIDRFNALISALTKALPE